MRQKETKRKTDTVRGGGQIDTERHREKGKERAGDGQTCRDRESDDTSINNRFFRCLRSPTNYFKICCEILKSHIIILPP